MERVDFACVYLCPNHQAACMGALELRTSRAVVVTDNLLCVSQQWRVTLIHTKYLNVRLVKQHPPFCSKNFLLITSCANNVVCYFSVLRAVEGWVGAREQAQVAESQLYQAMKIILTIDTRFWFQINVFVVRNIDITISIKHARSRHDYFMLSSPNLVSLLICCSAIQYIITTSRYTLLLVSITWSWTKWSDPAQLPPSAAPVMVSRPNWWPLLVLLLKFILFWSTKRQQLLVEPWTHY